MQFDLYDKPQPFANDSAGNVLVERIAVAAKPRSDSDMRLNQQKREKEKLRKAQHAEKITDELLKKVGIDFKPVAAELGVKAQFDSIKANCAKALVDRFAATPAQLRAFETIHYDPFDPICLSNEEEVSCEIASAINHMDKSKSSGSHGFARGESHKGPFLSNDLHLIEAAAKRRLKRLQIVGGDIGLFSGIELVQLGLRGTMFPAIKDEWHAERKVFKMKKSKDGSETPVLDDKGNRVECPHRWRSILMQSTIEYVVQYCLFKRQVAAQVRLLQEGGDLDKVIGQSAMVGTSTSEEGLARLRQVFNRLGELGEGVVRTSDITRLDWSVGALGGSHGFITLLSALNPDEDYASAVTAWTWASCNSVYQIGKCLYSQTRLGTVQTGMLCTSQEGGSARTVDSVLRWGVIHMPDGLILPVKPCISYSDDQVLVWGGPNCVVLDPSYSSPLDERDVEVRKIVEPIDFLGRYFQQDERESRETLKYELKRWENSIASIVEPRRRRKLQSSRSRLLPSSHTNARVDKAGALLEAIGELEDSVESLKANSQCMSHGSMNTNKDAAAIDSQGNPTSASGSFLARETAPSTSCWRSRCIVLLQHFGACPSLGRYGPVQNPACPHPAGGQSQLEQQLCNAPISTQGDTLFNQCIGGMNYLHF